MGKKKAREWPYPERRIGWGKVIERPPLIHWSSAKLGHRTVVLSELPHQDGPPGK
ncbi:hypothetical protein AAU01_10960 [Paenarthrobacter aurescens]|uniref:Uncharacterized protein n=1 Tax=Paenarthrobacter aurescens TaxID=43663 RepID=A0A4Y3NH06_PAEAU|nr:hypothetical protein AAU01_10960 [Paenarthrobacter aurescens]